MYGDPDGPIGRAQRRLRLGHVRLLHPQQHRHRVPVLRRRPLLRHRQPVRLAFNGAAIGSTAGYLTWRGFGANFYPFVVTHGAFELTGIVLAGAAGLILGHALLVAGPALAPGRARARGPGRDRHRLRHDRDVRRRRRARGVLVVGALGSARRSSIGVGAACWVAVIAYFVFQGRPRRGRAARHEGRRDPPRPAPARHVRSGRPRRPPRLRASALGLDELRAGLRVRRCSRCDAAAVRRSAGRCCCDLAQALARSLDPVRPRRARSSARRRASPTSGRRAAPWPGKGCSAR